MTGYARAILAALIIGSALPAVPALAAGSEVSVSVNMARILRINAPAATVIVGNPAVADVTIQDSETLVLTGRSFGTTNLIVLDQGGNPIIDTFVDVVRGKEADLVTVYQGDARTSLSCQPECQPVIMLGDDTDYTSSTIASSNLVANSAD